MQRLRREVNTYKNIESLQTKFCFYLREFLKMQLNFIKENFIYISKYAPALIKFTFFLKEGGMNSFFKLLFYKFEGCSFLIF